MRRDEFNQMKAEKAGYRVSYERRVRGVLESEMMPERDEPGIESEEEAWVAAAELAQLDPNFVNVYVIRAIDFTPVAGYEARRLNRYPDYARDEP